MRAEQAGRRARVPVVRPRAARCGRSTLAPLRNRRLTGSCPGYSWAWNPARLDELIRAAAPATLYVCGGAANELELADRFTQVFLLEIDEPTMLARIDARQDNDWGRIGDTRACLPLLAEKTFHGGATTYSWLIGALGAGAVAGGLYAARSGRTGVARLTSAAVFYAIAVGLVAAAPGWPAAVAACVLAGAATITFLTTGNATIQLAAEPGYRGRVTALWSMALVGSTAIGSPVIGVLSDVAGPRYALALGAAAWLAAAAIGHWRSTRASPPGVREGTTEDQRCIIRRAAVPHGGRRRSSSERAISLAA